jgi:hypothetical protein
VTRTEDAELRQRISGLVQSVEPSPVPLDEIIRQGKAVRLRRAVMAVGCLGLAGIIAAATMLAPRSSREPILPVSVPANGVAGPGGVFASGIADGHAWRLAVQDIADPGYRCVPAVTINGTDADPVYPGQGNSAAVTLGSANPGVGFAFVQLPADIGGLIVNGRQHLPAVAVTVCGERYRVVGFAYPLNETLRLTVANPPPGPVAAYVVPVPVVSPAPPATAFTPQTAGMWNNVGSISAETATATIATGTTSGRSWTITLLFGAGGDCYEFSSALAPNGPEMGACGPVSTPDGPETIMALPLGYPNPASGTIGYAVQVSPATAHLKATLSDGSTTLVTPRIVDGRKYAAFAVAPSVRVQRLSWLNAAGKEFARTTAVPLYGYKQFQP